MRIKTILTLAAGVLLGAGVSIPATAVYQRHAEQRAALAASCGYYDLKTGAFSYGVPPRLVAAVPVEDMLPPVKQGGKK